MEAYAGPFAVCGNTILKHVQQDGCSGVMNNSCIERFILGGPDIRSRDVYIVVIYVYSYFSMSP